MPTTFVQVGNHWINLELVVGIELVPDPNDPTRYAAARVHFTNGKRQDFTQAVDIHDLAAWLRAHKAP